MLGKRIILLVELMVLLTLLVGCDEDDKNPIGSNESTTTSSSSGSGNEGGTSSGNESTGGSSQAAQNLNTPNYAKEALKYNSSTDKYEFFTWVGSASDGGCYIPINVYDGSGSVPSNLNRSAAKQAVEDSRNRWKRAIKNIGISVSTCTRYESEGDAMHTRIPRIDVYYSSTINSDGARGSTYADVRYGDKSFRGVRIKIRSDLSSEQLHLTTNHEFGHAMGIYYPGEGQAHSSNRNDVMYSPSQYTTLTNGDKLTLKSIYHGTAFFKPYSGYSGGTDGKITVKHAAYSVHSDITVTVNGKSYRINPSQTITISGISGSTKLEIHECLWTGSRWDCGGDVYTVSPGGSYYVVDGSRGSYDMTLTTASPPPSGKITVKHATSVPSEITVTVNGKSYQINPGQTITINGIVGTTRLEIHECLWTGSDWNCRGDSYSVTAGGNYKVVDGSGGQWDMKLVNR